MSTRQFFKTAESATYFLNALKSGNPIRIGKSALYLALRIF